ncbi:MAG TPA: enoyl-CoA hydratase [Burkholderiaceae bacterium]|jgi:enoyl-CoA hydratase/carnithine racemase|nr:enoyl-CoA hydratase [Burkholderiaceae bacterium]
MDTMEAPVIGELADGVLTLTLNRPGQFNALSEDVLAGLQEALDRAAGDDALRCVVLAAGGRAFCAGHDLKQMQANRRHEYYLDLFRQCGRLMQSIVEFPVPVIAKVHGMATAAGCQLVASCDLAVAADTAKFAVSGINVGLFCSTPAVALSRNVGAKKAFEMLITGRFISAEDAVQHGLINQAVPADELDAAVESLVAEIRGKSPVAVRTGKAMFHRQRGMALDAAYEFAADVMARNMMAEDVHEGIDAFINKRHPEWKGR